MSQIVVRALRHHVLMAGLVRCLKHDADDSSRERNLNPKTALPSCDRNIRSIFSLDRPNKRPHGDPPEPYSSAPQTTIS